MKILLQGLLLFWVCSTNFVFAQNSSIEQFKAFAKSFQPTSIVLEDGLSALNEQMILQSINTNAHEADIQVAILILKLHLFHLQCFDLPYNLNCMQTGGTDKMIFDRFEQISGITNPEYVSSWEAYDWVESKENFSKDKEIKEVLNAIKKEKKRLKQLSSLSQFD